MRRKKKKRTEISESWLLPYADMLTLLLALFIILFAGSEMDAQKYQQLAEVFRSEFASGGAGIIDEDPPREVIPEPDEEDSEEEKTESQSNSDTRDPRLQRIKKTIDIYISENDLQGNFNTELTPEGLMLTIEDDIFFDKGSAEVRPDARRTAAEVAELLYSDPPHEVVISGHTDDIPISNSSYASNWDLSVARAVNFMTVVLENEHLDPTLFSAKGYGEYQPAVPNTSEENREKNRRVEILVLPNESAEGL